MRKTKLLLPVVGIATLSGAMIPLVSCDNHQNNPLCFTDVADDGKNAVISYELHGLKGTVDINYKLDDDEWKPWSEEDPIHLQNGQKLYVKNTKNTLSKNSSEYFNFVMSGGDVEASGNVDSMINYADLSDGCYIKMFESCHQLTKAPELPATKLAPNCYKQMFDHCTFLTQPPILPAMELAPYCYTSMFTFCTRLPKAPELPATTLADSCYETMFDTCRLLTKAPALPAEQLFSGCYGSMFHSCNNLKEPPQLPSKTLASACYFHMFSKCGLTKAPVLPAETLASQCYQGMFSECINLKVSETSSQTTNDEGIICTFDGNLIAGATQDMFSDIASTSEFRGTPTDHHTYSWYTEEN